MIANPATLGLGEMLRGEAGRTGADAVLALMAERITHAAEPPAPVAAAMKAADVVLAPTVQSLSHTASRKAASEAGARIATLPGVTEEILARVMSADMAELRRRGNAIADAMNAGSEARLTCANGSDLRMGLEGRTAIPDAGELTEPSAFGNLPCGEGFISPDDRASEGTLVVDGTIAGVGRVSEPVRMTVAGGRLTEASGPEGAALLDLLLPARGGGDDDRRARDRDQREGAADRQRDRGREAARHRPRRLRRLPGDRRADPGPGPPRLRGDAADRDDRRHRDRPRGGAAAVMSTLDRPMLLAVPNISEGTETEVIASIRRCIAADPVALLDEHSDPVHNRTVYTLAGADAPLVRALTDIARCAIERIDMSRQQGAHPRIGALDVCPIVWPKPALRDSARETALAVAEQLASLGLPVFLYGELASTPERRERAYFRRGGPEALRQRMLDDDLEPDLGPGWPHATAGGVLITARAPLAAFNIELEGADLEAAEAIAAKLRESGGGPPGVRAMAIDLGEGRMQISTNIHDPGVITLGNVVDVVRRLAREHDARPIAAELVGLVPAAALDHYPEDVPIAGPDPHRRTIEAHVSDLQG